MSRIPTGTTGFQLHQPGASPSRMYLIGVQLNGEGQAR